MTKLITAEEARQMSADIKDNFINNEMEPYIEYLNNKIEEEIKKGRTGVYFWYDYSMGVAPDPVISELSEDNLATLIEYLESNGYYVKLTSGALLFIAWWKRTEKPEPVKEEPKKKSMWDIWGNYW